MSLAGYSRGNPVYHTHIPYLSWLHHKAFNTVWTPNANASRLSYFLLAKIIFFVPAGVLLSAIAS